MEDAFVSVIIPVFNGEQFLGETIESVLDQTYRPLEIVVVDDGSDDGTSSIAQSFREVTYIYQNNQGHGMAKNTGVKASRGAFLSFLDADDLWSPDKLSVQVGYLQENPEIGFVICNMRQFIDPESTKPTWMDESDLTRDIPAYIPSALVVRRNAFEELGFFNPQLLDGNDTDWHFRAKDAGIPMANINQVLLYRRIHASNLSHNRGRDSRLVNDLFIAVKASIDRKRN